MTPFGSLRPIALATTTTPTKGICANAKYNNAILEKVRSPASRSGEILATPLCVQVDDCDGSHLSPGRELGGGMEHHLASHTVRLAFTLGVLAGVYGKKLHGAIVEVAFFKPNLYAHLPAVSFVD